MFKIPLPGSNLSKWTLSFLFELSSLTISNKHVSGSTYAQIIVWISDEKLLQIKLTYAAQ